MRKKFANKVKFVVLSIVTKTHNCPCHIKTLNMALFGGLVPVGGDSGRENIFANLKCHSAEHDTSLSNDTFGGRYLISNEVGKHF